MLASHTPASSMSPSWGEAFSRGDQDAVRHAYDTYGTLVYAVANRVLRDRSLAEEATQQAFLQAWRAAASFDPSREIGPWLATIARRAAIDLHRRKVRRPTIDLDTALKPDSPDQSVFITMPPSIEDTEAVWQVRAAVDALPALDREIISLQYFEQLTQREIADRMNLPLGTVKSRAHRAHKVLARRLDHLRGSYAAA